ncbi:hypothetical protein WI77_28145 [Burkholderia ubonensis]|nr:hypothetical protein WI77_28145 [Burkholderia ubonensis]
MTGPFISAKHSAIPRARSSSASATSRSAALTSMSVTGSAAPSARVVRPLRERLVRVDQPRVRHSRRDDAGAAVNHDGMPYALALQAFLGIPVVELQPDTPHGRARQACGVGVHACACGEVQPPARTR